MLFRKRKKEDITHSSSPVVIKLDLTVSENDSTTDYPADITPIIEFISNNSLKSVSHRPYDARFYVPYCGPRYKTLEYETIVIELETVSHSYKPDSSRISVFNSNSSPQLDLFDNVPEHAYVGSIDSADVHPEQIKELTELMTRKADEFALEQRLQITKNVLKAFE